MSYLIVALAIAAAGAVSHEEQNPVYRELLEPGVTSGDQSRKLPPPTVADGLSAENQIKAIETLGGAQYSYDKLTRQSVVAPQIIRVPSVQASEGKSPLRTADVWFVVYADLDALADREFLGKLLEGRQSEGRAKTLTPEQLRSRGIKLAEKDADHEAFSHLTYDLLDKVRVSVTARSCWSRSEDSVVAAAMLDRRFAGDAEFPNEWRRLERSSQGGDAGPGHPYEGLGFYAKITRLARPAGALLVEYHAVFAEPVEWFRGTNQLGAKLPAVIQNQVREARRKMMQSAKPSDNGR